jgi:hypothetical protein
MQIRNPRAENEQSLRTYLDKNQLRSDNLLIIKDTAAFYKIHREGYGMPEISFYDRNGYLMKFRDEQKCNAQNDSLISFLNPEKAIGVDSARRLSDFTSLLLHPDRSPISKTELSGHDYYLIMFWAKYLGKLNSKKLGDWERSLAANKKANHKVYKLSMDYQDFWNLPKKEMFRIYGSKIKFR